MQQDFNEKNNEPNVEKEESTYAYKNVINKEKQNRRTWSVFSLLFAIASVFTFIFSWVSLVLGFISVGCGVVSRKNLGYFDGISVAGIIIGIFGIVFALAGLIFGNIISSIL
ncbi:MAG: hypothetical protein IJX97_06975 [Clostridia bacterium]|nr:hypothetical protein [Clostridia bacterium]